MVLTKIVYILLYAIHCIGPRIVIHTAILPRRARVPLMPPLTRCCEDASHHIAGRPMIRLRIQCYTRNKVVSVCCIVRVYLRLLRRKIITPLKYNMRAMQALSRARVTFSIISLSLSLFRRLFFLSICPPKT